jgi:hypothetical protein
MNRRWIQASTLCLGAAALLCWVVMFLAGTDIWHAAGRPALWDLQGSSYQDLRAFAYAFYALPILLGVHVALTAAGLIASRRRVANQSLRP